MDISIIIPAYNEEEKISKDIVAADKFISDNYIKGEIIVVDDGSTDNTSNIAEELKNKIVNKLNIIRIKQNLGKGAAVKEGVSNSSGRIILYADAGLTVPFENSLLGIKLIEDGKCEIANGSRKISSAEILKDQDFDRKIISKIFYFFSKLLLKIPKEMTDTQCGFKVYKGDVARKLFKQLRITGFLFELEIIMLAVKNNYRILEFPVTWRCDRDSRLSVRKSSKKIILDFIKLLKE